MRRTTLEGDISFEAFSVIISGLWVFIEQFVLVGYTLRVPIGAFVGT